MAATNDGLRLLCLDGGGVKGLSSLLVLQHLMSTVNPENPPKPCEFFDIIGGTSTGGLIAIMLGRLKMSISSCIDAYIEISKSVFMKQERYITWRGKIQGRFDAHELETQIKRIIKGEKLEEDALFLDTGAECKVFVCAVRKEKRQVAILRSYVSPRNRSQVLQDCKIWEAARATSAATSFFKPVSIGALKMEFLDGAVSCNNPVEQLYTEALDIWPDMEKRLSCLVSIGTGMQLLKPFGDSVREVWKTLVDIATETEEVAELFRRSHRRIVQNGQYFRFNVSRGLEDVGLGEHEKLGTIAQATLGYVESEEVLQQVIACAKSLSGLSNARPSACGISIPISLPFAQNPRFVGREPEVMEIHKIFTTPFEGRQRSLALVGTGGIGKSQVALEYVYKYSRNYSSVFWVNSNTENSVISGFADAVERILHHLASDGNFPRAAQGLGLSNTVDDKGRLSRRLEEKEQIVDALHRWFLRESNNDWLVIFDSYDRIEEFSITRYFPRNLAGNILVTSRRPDCKQFVQHYIELERLDEGAALSLLLGGHKQNEATEMEIARKLVHAMDGFPLALSQARAYMDAVGGIELQTFYEAYMQYFNKVFLKRPRGDWSYNETVLTTWEMSFDAVTTENAKAADLLLVCSFLNNDEISEDVLRKGLELDGDSLMLEEVIESLLSYSLVKRKIKEACLWIHPVIHAWARERLTQEDKAKIARRVMEILGRSLESESNGEDGPSYPHWFYDSPLVHHVFSFLRCTGDWMPSILTEENKYYYYLINRTVEHWDDWDALNLPGIRGFTYGSDIRESIAPEQCRSALESVFRRALTAMEQGLGLLDHRTLSMSNNLAMLLYQQQKFEEAATLLRTVYTHRKKSLGAHHPQTLITTFNLALVMQELGDQPKSESMFRRALVEREKSLGLEHPDTLDSAFYLGLHLDHRGQDREAESLIRRVLAARMTTGWARPKWLQFSLCMDNNKIIGYTCVRCPDKFWNGAGPIYNYVTVSHLLSILIRQKKGKLREIWRRDESGEIGQIVQEMVGRFVELFVEDSGSWLRTQCEIAKVLGDDHKDLEAEAMFWALVEEFEELLTLNDTDNLALLHRIDGGRIKIDETHLLRILHGKERFLGSGHWSTLVTMGHLAIFYRSQDKHAKAEPVFRQILDGDKERLGEEHSRVLNEMVELAYTLRFQEKRLEAESMLRQAALGMKKTLGPRHDYTLKAMKLLALSLWEQKLFDEATSYYEEVLGVESDALDTESETYGPKYLEVLYTTFLLATVKYEAGKWAEAEALFQKVLAGREEWLEADHPNVIQCREWLEKTQRNQGTLAPASPQERGPESESQQHGQSPKSGD